MLALPITSQAKPVAIVCHDAGAANIILSWVGSGDAKVCRIYLEGPAVRLWSLMHTASTLMPTLEAALDGAQTLISGTGWGSDLEHHARQAASERSMRSVAVIDHWVNYPQRFERGGVTVLPDEIWVTDSFALEKAGPLFPTVLCRQFENPYIGKQLRRIPPLPPADTGDILYVLEPARSTWGRDIDGEFQALDYFIDSLPKLGLPDTAVIRLRPHPSDIAGKYDSWIAAQQHRDIRLDGAGDMAEAISPARWVAGCESVGLVLALEAGRIVFSTLPPWAHACRLPHTGIVHLRSLELQ